MGKGDWVERRRMRRWSARLYWRTKRASERVMRSRVQEPSARVAVSSPQERIWYQRLTAMVSMSMNSSSVVGVEFVLEVVEEVFQKVRGFAVQDQCV